MPSKSAEDVAAFNVVLHVKIHKSKRHDMLQDYFALIMRTDPLASWLIRL
jgi:hypothetical protein